MKKYTIYHINSKDELCCKDENGDTITIDAHTDRDINDKEEFEWKVGDVIECEVFPYIPLYFARYSTIKKEMK